MLPWRCSTMTCRILRVFTAKKLFPLTQTLKSSSCALITVSQITLLSSAFAVKAKANRPVCMLGWLCQKVIAAFCVLKSYKKWLGVLVKSITKKSLMSKGKVSVLLPSLEWPLLHECQYIMCDVMQSLNPVCFTFPTVPWLVWCSVTLWLLSFHSDNTIQMSILSFL